MIKIILKFLKFLLEILSKISLKNRLIVVLFINCLVTLSLVGFVSYLNISSLHEKKVQGGIQSSLDSVRNSIQSAYRDLENISKQFAYENTVISDGAMVNDLKEYVDFIDGKTNFNDKQVIDFRNKVNRLYENVNFKTLINPVVGLSFFYRAGNDNQILFSSTVMNATSYKKQEIPIVSASEYIILNGMHKTISDNSNDVISVERKMEMQGLDDVYVYIETSSQWFNNLFRNKNFGMNNVYIMTNSKNEIIYSSNQKMFVSGQKLNLSKQKNKPDSWKDYYIFNSDGENNWTIMVAVSKSDYNHEIIRWIFQFAIIVILSLFVTSLMTIFIWKWVYRPIRAFRREFQLLAGNFLNPYVRKTRIKEYDELLIEFYNARSSVIKLMKQIETEEKKQKELEVEKLLIQINPHFIHNTLNSIQWMARLNGQKDIEKMTTLFTRVLQYNLGKGDIIVTINDELNALQNYIELQRMRYQFNLDVIINIEQSLKELKIPRFILQPLVENAIFHGADSNQEIFVKVSVSKINDLYFGISVEDNGKGITDEEIKRLLNGENNNIRIGLGIGLKYVNSMINFYYGNLSSMQIKSEAGKGTAITIKLPIKPDVGKSEDIPAEIIN